MSALPEGWRRLSSKALDDWLNTIDPRDDSLDAECDEVFAELEARDRQAAANRGEMNGLAPEH